MKKGLILLFSLFAGTIVSAQTDGCWQSAQRGTTTMSKSSFDSLVRHYNYRLKHLQRMDTTDYITMVKMHNSIFFNRYGSSKEGCWPEKDPLYVEFDARTNGKLFFDKLTRYLGLCIPNRGMGCYYYKYNLDYGGGGPNENSLIKVY